MLIVQNLPGTAPESGKRFAVTVIRYGERYGRDFRIVNDETDKVMGGRGETMVEFWDLSYPHGPVRPDSPVLGQFTGGRYFLRTLLEGNVVGLNLDGGSPEWTIDAMAMSEVRGWLVGLGLREVHEATARA